MEDLFMNNSGNGTNARRQSMRSRLRNNMEEVTDRVLKVEHGVPIPKAGHGQFNKRTRKNNPIVAILLGMEVGESMLIPTELVRSVRSALTIVRKEYRNNKYITRQVQPRPEFRVWRIQ